MKKLIYDSYIMTKRNLKISLRNIDVLVMSFIMPAILMIMFVFLFGGAMDIDGQFGGISYVNYIVAAVIILAIGQCAASSAVAINTEMSQGITDRFLSLPISRSSILIGHVTANVIRNIVSTIIVIAVALLIGFRPEASFLAWLAIIAILIVFMFIMAWLSILFGLITKSPEAAGTILITAMLLPYLSSGFVPTSTMPIILRQISEVQPMTPIIETLRSLLLNLDTAMWLETILWSVGLLVAFYLLALRAFKKKIK